MRTPLSLLVMGAALCASASSLNLRITAARPSPDSLARMQEVQNGPWGAARSEAVRAFLRPRTKTFGTDPARYAQAITQRDAMAPETRRPPLPNQPNGVWGYVGPNNLGAAYDPVLGVGPVSGRKTGIAISESNPSIMYLSSAGGGVWKSIDAGLNWKALSDQWPNVNASCVAIHPNNPNLVLAGTGDWRGFFQGRNLGIMRSLDGGAYWTQVGTPSMKGETITKILFNPAVPNQVLCTTAGGSDPNYGGLYRSNNNGSSWSQVQAGHHFVDMSIATSGALWVTAVGPDTPGQRGLIQKSADFGITLSPVANPAANLQTTLLIAASTVDANRAYVLAPGDKKIYRTTNAGTSWVNITGNFPMGTATDPTYNWSDPAYNAMIGCSKVGSVDLIFVGLKTVAQSLGGNGGWLDFGRSYSDTSKRYVHEGINCLTVHPTNPTQVFLGTDGGLFKYSYSPTLAISNWTSLNRTIGDTMHYHLSVDDVDPGYILSGTEGDGTAATRGDPAVWIQLGRGTGGWSALGRGNGLTTSPKGTLLHWAPRNALIPVDISPETPETWAGAFLPPVVYSETLSGPVTADNYIRRLNGTSWESVGEILTPNAGEYATTLTTRSNRRYGWGMLMYAGTSDGHLSELSRHNLLDGADPRSIGAISCKDPGTWTQSNTLVGYEDFGGNQLIRSKMDGWYPFASATGNLPDVPINDVIWDTNNASTWYVATDIGVFNTMNNGVSYTYMNAVGLPNVHVTSLAIGPDNYLYAATFGRGIWRLPLGLVSKAFNISGTATTAANLAFPDVSLALKRWREYWLAFTSSPNTSIPDYSTTGIISSLPISLDYPVTGGTLYLNITHPSKGNLEVTLYAPDGQQWRVHDRTGGTDDNIVGNFDFNGFASGMLGTGTWKLKVRDLVLGDVGTLKTWKITPKFFTYVTEQTVATGATGTYTFPSLEAGKYKVEPTFAGKTFDPAYRIMNLGPSMTLQDFKASP